MSPSCCRPAWTNHLCPRTTADPSFCPKAARTSSYCLTTLSCFLRQVARASLAAATAATASCGTSASGHGLRTVAGRSGIGTPAWLTDCAQPLAVPIRQSAYTRFVPGFQLILQDLQGRHFALGFRCTGRCSTCNVLRGDEVPIRYLQFHPELSLLAIPLGVCALVCRPREKEGRHGDPLEKS